MKARIVLPYGNLAEIASIMGVSREYASRALNGHVSTPLALRVRKCAINHGGREVAPDANLAIGDWDMAWDTTARRAHVRIWDGRTYTLDVETNILTNDDDPTERWGEDQPLTMDLLYEVLRNIAAPQDATEG